MPKDGSTNIERQCSYQKDRNKRTHIIMAAIRETASALVCKPDIEQVNTYCIGSRDPPGENRRTWGSADHHKCLWRIQ
jgi:hypothetical protein